MGGLFLFMGGKISLIEIAIGAAILFYCVISIPEIGSGLKGTYSPSAGANGQAAQGTTPAASNGKSPILIIVIIAVIAYFAWKLGFIGK